MATTIQVEDETLDMLKKYKEQFKANSYDEVIKKFMKIGDHIKAARGIFGKKDMYFIKKEAKLLRDKKDRF